MVNISCKNESVYTLPQLIYAFQSQLQKPVSSVGELLHVCVCHCDCMQSQDQAGLISHKIQK